ncbi:MAG TPA: transglycosylase domain-containing protein [Thermoanaerobaculaceae bacterium]|nr:transglycosylase domain-containing protein [Thermoanaerobaculaceae bacterium]HRS16735.1 transglycosylase domain-containing protein [Thermoanaerobaculaceae bacterium]
MGVGRRGRILLRWLAVLVGLGCGGAAVLVVYGVHLVDAAMASPGRSGVVVLAAPLELEPGAPWTVAELREALLRRGGREVAGSPGPGEIVVEGSRLLLGPGLCLGRAEVVTVETGARGIRPVLPRGEAGGVSVRGPVIGTTASGDVVRWPVPLAEISPHLLTAVVDVEDRTFLSHAGLSFRGLLRAAIRDLAAGGVRQGGSTITQQLAKMLMLRPSRTLPRKVLEAWLATLLDFRYSKQEILEAYLNRVYLGQDGGWQIQGVAPAASYYFGKRASELAIDEAALLAGIIAAPNRHDPFAHPEAALARRRVVLQAMVREGHLDGGLAEVLAARPLPPAPRRLRWPAAAQALELILGELAGEKEISSSLDVDFQAAVAEAVPAAIARLEAASPRLRELATTGDRLQAAVVVLAVDGRLLALVGSRSGAPGEFNRASAARRPIGSLVKPFVAAMALGRGWAPGDRLDDSPLQVQIGTQFWEPRNSDGEFRGAITLADALVLSRNVPMVRLGLALGVREVAEGLRAYGFAVDRPHPSILLGAFEATPLQVARAYAALAGRGWLPVPTWRPQAATGSPVGLDPEAATAVLDVLADVPRRGTAASLAGKVEGWLAAKTGTTDERRDSWFVAVRPGYVAAVWVGTDGNAQTGLYGATGALEVWKDIDGRLPRARRLGGGGQR